MLFLINFLSTILMLSGSPTESQPTPNIEAEPINIEYQQELREIEQAELIRFQEELDRIKEYETKEAEVLAIQKTLDKIHETNNELFYELYMDMCYDYQDYFDLPETIYDYYSEEDIYLMQRTIETETYQRSFDAKVNVATVILNRIESGNFGSTVSEVIIPGQFAFGRKEISSDTIAALEYAFMFGNEDLKDALYFHSNKKTRTFHGYEYIMTDDAGHHFY